MFIVFGPWPKASFECVVVYLTNNAALYRHANHIRGYQQFFFLWKSREEVVWYTLDIEES